MPKKKSESMNSLVGGGPTPPPLEKGLSYRVEMHVYSPVFQGQLIDCISVIQVFKITNLLCIYKKHHI